MSMSDDVVQCARAQVSRVDASVSLSPTTIANGCYAVWAHADDDLHVRWAAIEHFKQVARAVLADRYGPEAKDSEAYQDDLFSGHLQSRYPTPRSDQSADPIYKPREALTRSELKWNIDLLRKSAGARLRHADALQSYSDARDASSSAA